MIYKNKRAEGNVFTDNIISALVIVVVAAVALFFVWQIVSIWYGQETKNVKNSLEYIVETIKQFEETGGEYSFLLQGFKGAENWFVAGWSAGEVGRPDKCYFESCVCVCNKDAKGEKAGEKCQARGYCETVKVDRLVVGALRPAKAFDFDELLLPSNIAEAEVSVIKVQDGITVGIVNISISDNVQENSNAFNPGSPDLDSSKAASGRRG